MTSCRFPVLHPGAKLPSLSARPAPRMYTEDRSRISAVPAACPNHVELDELLRARARRRWNAQSPGRTGTYPPPHSGSEARLKIFRVARPGKDARLVQASSWPALESALTNSCGRRPVFPICLGIPPWHTTLYRLASVGSAQFFHYALVQRRPPRLPIERSR